MDFRHRPALATRRHLVLTAYPASVSVSSVLSAVRACSEYVEMLIPFPSLNLQPSIEDPGLAENFNVFTKLSFQHSRTSLQMPVYAGQEASSHVLPQPGFLRCRAASDAVY